MKELLISLVLIPVKICLELNKMYHYYLDLAGVGFFMAQQHPLQMSLNIFFSSALFLFLVFITFFFSQRQSMARGAQKEQSRQVENIVKRYVMGALS